MLTNILHDEGKTRTLKQLTQTSEGNATNKWRSSIVNERKRIIAVGREEKTRVKLPHLRPSQSYICESEYDFTLRSTARNTKYAFYEY